MQRAYTYTTSPTPRDVSMSQVWLKFNTHEACSVFIRANECLIQPFVRHSDKHRLCLTNGGTRKLAVHPRAPQSIIFLQSIACQLRRTSLNQKREFVLKAYIEEVDEIAFDLMNQEHFQELRLKSSVIKKLLRVQKKRANKPEESRAHPPGGL